LFVWHEERRRAEQPEQTGPTAARDAQLPLGENPYRGLEAFRKKDADRFFGREALIDQLWNAFLKLHAVPTDGEAPTRLLAILGASGSGKSSVAQAGLLAELEKRPLPGRPAPIEVVFTPEARPLESLSVALARQAKSVPSPPKTAIKFEKVLRSREGHDGLRYLTGRALDAGGGLILLVDQFEQLYSLCEEKAERAAFIDNLLNAAREPRGNVSIVLTLRSDFLGAVNQHPELSALIAKQNVVVPVMQEAELRRAIAEPAKQAGREIHPDTVARLVGETLGREGALPLLEFVLTQIWDGFAQDTEAADTLERLNGVAGALAKKAAEIYAKLDKREQMIARRAFLAMVQLGEGTKDTRRRARLSHIVVESEADDAVLRVLRRFADARLISIGRDL
jgi:Cdc6-like AAA superfamily ATPase